MTTEDMYNECMRMIEEDLQEIKELNKRFDDLSDKLVRFGDELRDFRYDVESNLRRFGK